MYKHTGSIAELHYAVGIFSIFAVMLFACSKAAQDHSKITLVIDGKATLREKAAGANLPQFNSKHAPLIWCHPCCL
jgi:hypothetical protein